MVEMRNSLVVTADASQVVGAARQWAASLDTVSGAATKTARALQGVEQASADATDMGQRLDAAFVEVGSGSGAVEQAVVAMATGLDAASGAATRTAGALQVVDQAGVKAAEMAQRLNVAFNGFAVGGNSAEASAAAMGAALDALRARFDPLFAASRQYEAELEAIAEAERLGALTAIQAAEARKRAASIISTSPNGGATHADGATNFYATSLMSQWNDIAMMTAAGQSPMMLVMQQGTQVSQTFAMMRASGMSLGKALSASFMGMLNPMSLVTMAVIGFGAAAVQALMDSSEKAKSLDDAMSELGQTSNELKSAFTEASKGTVGLYDEFGTGAVKARELNAALLDLAQIQAEQALRESLNKIGDSIGDLASFGVTNISTLRKEFNLTERGAFSVAAAMQKFSSASTVEDQTKAAEQLLEAFRKAEYATGGASTKALDFAENAGKAAIEALRIAGYSEQAAKLQAQLAQGNIAAPYLSAADAAKQLADETARILKDTGTAAKMRTDMEAQAKINAAIVTYGRDSVEVKQLQIDAARAEYAESLKTLKVNDDIKKALMEQWELTNGLKSADPFGTAAAARSILETQSQSLAKLQLEQTLLGQSEASRRRVLALYEAELEIRQKGISPTSAIAEQIRQGAVAEAELTDAVKRQAGAWDEVSKAAETAIDKLLGGDLKGALESIAKEFEQLALVNPLKNALLGTEYATLNDAGGLGGIWDRLTGKTPAIDPAKAAATAAAQAVSTMQVTAANVIIGGAGVAQLAGGSGPDRVGAANIWTAPIVTSVGTVPLGGSSSVQSQVWAYFAGKGLAPHQIAAIMGNVAGESSFNPLAQGDKINGQYTSFGLFQHHGERATGLLNAVGGVGGLGNVQGQLDYVWKELLGSHSGALAALKAAPDLQSATSAWMREFEAPSAAAMTQSFPKRMAAAETAMAKFSTTTTTATANLGTMGSGFDVFGSSLASAAQGFASGGAQGGVVGLFGTLATGLAHIWGLPGYEVGGDTGGSDPRRVAGVVHEAEYVFDAASTRRIGVRNLDALRAGALRGYEVGGFVSHAADYPHLRGASAQSDVAGTVVQLQPVLVNNTSTPMRMEVQEVTDSRGQRQQRYVLSDAVAEGVMAPGGKAGRSLRQAYGLSRTGIPR